MTASASPFENPLGASQSPFLRAPEKARTIFLMTILAAMGPLGAGLVFFGWRAIVIALLSIASCVLIERLYYRITRVPALLGRSHAFLTGVLLALTLPAFVPWYVPVVAAAFAILLGKAIFGGVGHFLWQPALVGRLAVAVIFAQQLTNPFPDHPQSLPLLAQKQIITGNLMQARVPSNYQQWRRAVAPLGADGFLLQPPSAVLSGLTKTDEPQFSALAFVPAQVSENDGGIPAAKPAALMQLPPINDLIYGASPGGIGETCAIVIIIGGLYLIYRNYVKWQLCAAFILSAAAVAAFAPIQLQGVGNSAIFGWGPMSGWLSHDFFSSRWNLPPLLVEGLDVGMLYVTYQILSGDILLAAFFLAPEMTSRPVTNGGQVIFGIGCGVAAMLLKLYVDVQIPAYIAVLMMNTFSPMIDSIWRPRVFGKRSLIKIS